MRAIGHGQPAHTLIAMTEIYRGLLKKVAYQPQRVLRKRVSLSLFSEAPHRLARPAGRRVPRSSGCSATL